MAAVKPESNSQVLEDSSDALHPEPEIEEDEELVDLEAADEPETPAVPAKKPEKPAKKTAKADATAEDDLPEDLKGKSPKELARMYREAQSVIGRQGSELGEFRRKADLLIQASLANLAAGRKAEPAAAADDKKDAPELDDTEFFANPKEAIAKAVANHPLIKQIEATLGKDAATRETERATRSTEKFNSTHPDASTIMQDPEFRTWVGASRVRTALLKRAHEKFDFDAGDEVFGTWKALKSIKKPEPAVKDGAGGTSAASTDVSAAARTLAAQQKRKQALRDAATPTGGAGGGKESGSKKIYRRADVLRLMEEDSERYEALAPEIERAYAEGRVR